VKGIKFTLFVDTGKTKTIKKMYTEYGDDIEAILNSFGLVKINTKIQLIRARITNDEYKNAMDLDNSPPDCVVEVKQNGKTIYTSEKKQDEYNPEWNSTFNITFESGDKIDVNVLDKDLTKDDWLFGWNNLDGKAFPWEGRLEAPKKSRLIFRILEQTITEK
jgi:hypothetical protein